MDILSLIERYTEGQLRVLSAASALLHESEEKTDEKGKSQRLTVKKPPKSWMEMKKDPDAYQRYLESAGL